MDGFVKTKTYDKQEYCLYFLNFSFLNGDGRHPMVIIFLNFFDLLEYPVMMMILILVIRF